MGQRIKSYSLEELNKVNIPGKIIPSLFWLIPIGKWDYYYLEELWNLFTKEDSLVKRIGVMLVDQEFGRRKENNNKANLTEITGKLTEIFPKGTNLIYTDDFSNKDRENQALILSSLYPQPGWGVLVDFDIGGGLSYYKLERIIEKSVDVSTIQLFETAIESFKSWDDYKGKKPIKNEFFDESDLTKYKEIVYIINKILKENESKDFCDFSNYIDELTKYTSVKELGNIKDFIDLKTSHIRLASVILKFLNKETNKKIIDKKLQALCNSKDNFEEFFIQEKNNSIKIIAGAFLKLDERLRPDKNFVEWASQTYKEKGTLFIEKLNQLKLEITRKIGEIEIEKDTSLEPYHQKDKEWREKLEDLRLKYHQNLREVLDFIHKYGPELLYKIENLICRYSRSVPKSFAWDPARMVGWKIFSNGLQISTFDVIYAMRQIIPSLEIDHNGAYDNSTYLNGSLFTDFVHYISLKDQTISPRDATKRLLSQIMLPSAILKILEKPVNANLGIQNTDLLVEELLNKLGWPAKNEAIYVYKLAECIIIENGENKINSKLHGSQIRTSLENYLKDFIATLSSIIGGSESELINIIEHHRPDYNFQVENWNYEISRITIGGARIVIDALLKHALPEKAQISKDFLKILSDLNQRLNLLSHDPPQGNTADLAGLIEKLLGYTHDLISEMPWHFYPVQVNGHQPKVLTGNAWSHSHRESRQLSIILWSDEDVQSESLLVWNPEKTNPVVPNGKLIKRLGKKSG